MLNNKYLIINILFNASALNVPLFFMFQQLDCTVHLRGLYGSATWTIRSSRWNIEFMPIFEEKFRRGKKNFIIKYNIG